MKTAPLLRKLSLVLCVCLLLAALSACKKAGDAPEQDDFDIPESSPGVMDPDFTAIEFDAYSIVLTPGNAYRYDDPIEEQAFEERDSLVLGNWQSGDAPAAYWGVVIPDDGDYYVSVSFTRTADEDARGALAFEQWDDAEGQWVNFNTTAMTFEGSDEIWETVKLANRSFGGMSAGTYRFSIAPADIAEESGMFIRVITVSITKVDDGDDGFVVDPDAPILDGTFCLDGDPANEDWLTFNDDSTGSMYISGGEADFLYAIDEDTIFLYWENGSDAWELQIFDDDTLYLEEFDDTYYRG